MSQIYQSTLEDLKERASTGYVSPLKFAGAYTKLGDKGQALTWLEKTAAEHSPSIVHIATDPDYDAVRSDPRFTALVKRMGLAGSPP